MPATLPTPTKSKFRRTISCLGDSLTDNMTLGNLGSEFWPSLLQKYLTEDAPITDGLAQQPGPQVNCKARNFGQSGNTSGPLPVATAVCNTVTDSQHATFTSVNGTFKAGQTVLINGVMNQLNTYSGGAAVFYYPLPGSITSGNNYTVYGVSDFGADNITRLNLMLGNKTPKALDLLFQFGAPEWDPPDIAAIWIGVNDPTTGSGRVAITGFNLNTTIKTAPSLSAAQWPAPAPGGTTLIPLQTGQGANAVIGQAVTIVDWTKSTPQVWVGLICNVVGDTIYVSQNTHAIHYNFSNWESYFAGTAGCQNPLPGPGFPPVGASVYQGTEANIIGNVLMLLLYGGTSKFLILNAQYLNYAGGDTLATPYATYATLRTYQAVTLLQSKSITGAVLVDLYTYMRNLIANGSTFSYRQTLYTAVAADNAWHSVTTNQHLNPLGNSIVAMAALAAIQAQSGWLDALRA